VSSPGFAMPQGAWAQGDLLIASHSAVLPAFCVKCGRPAQPKLMRRMSSWHQPWLYFLILVGVLIYAIVALILRKSMTLHLPLCARHLEKYRALKFAYAVLLLGCIPEMILAGTLLPEAYVPYGIAAGLSALVAGMVCLVMFNGILRAKRIDESYGYFTNASGDFLSHLPAPPAGVMLAR